MTLRRRGSVLAAWWRRRRERRREAGFRRLGIPDDVRARMAKCGELDPPSWYAGRREDDHA